MKKSSLSYFLAVLVAIMLPLGGAASRAQQTQQTEQSDTTAKSKSKSKSKTKAAAADSAPKPATASDNTPAAATSSTPTPAAPTAPASKSAPAPKPAAQHQTPSANSVGTVWVNTDSGVYHKPGTRWYGKTKQGKYMTEADAQKAGYRAADKE